MSKPDAVLPLTKEQAEFGHEHTAFTAEAHGGFERATLVKYWNALDAIASGQPQRTKK